MGYDIQFILELPDRPEDGPDSGAVAAQLAEIADGTPRESPSHPANCAFWEEVLRGSQFITWYDCEKQMAEVSKLYPGKLLTLELRGENAGDDDFWKFYFRDGLVQKEKGRMVYGGFNPAGLHPPSTEEYDITTHPLREAMEGR